MIYPDLKIEYFFIFIGLLCPSRQLRGKAIPGNLVEPNGPNHCSNISFYLEIIKFHNVLSPRTSTR